MYRYCSLHQRKILPLRYSCHWEYSFTDQTGIETNPPDSKDWNSDTEKWNIWFSSRILRVGQAIKSQLIWSLSNTRLKKKKDGEILKCLYTFTFLPLKSTLVFIHASCFMLSKECLWLCKMLLQKVVMNHIDNSRYIHRHREKNKCIIS